MAEQRTFLEELQRTREDSSSIDKACSIALETTNSLHESRYPMTGYAAIMAPYPGALEIVLSIEEGLMLTEPLPRKQRDLVHTVGAAMTKALVDVAAQTQRGARESLK